jgi:hypothetical protein
LPHENQYLRQSKTRQPECQSAWNQVGGEIKYDLENPDGILIQADSKPDTPFGVLPSVG